jgi:putative flippase GtrA
MPKKDIFLTIIVGLLTAVVWGGVFLRLGTFDKLGFGWAVWGLIVIVPLGYVFGLYLGDWLGRRIAFFSSLAKYVMVGFLNTGIDFAVFNLLMYITGIEQGPFVSSFKTISFVIAVTNSYFWNKYWAFHAGSSAENKAKEFIKFIVVNIVGALINVGITSAVIFLIAPKFGFTQLSWNNIAAVGGTVISLLWNFVGFRLIVFKRNDPSSISQISS